MFAVGFVLGTVRVLWLEGAVGRIAATLAELPAMLGVSYVIARRVLRRYAITTPRHALRLGAWAFSLLLAFELLAAMVISGRSPMQWIAQTTTTAGLLGLSGQMLFGLMPWIVLRAQDAGKA